MLGIGGLYNIINYLNQRQDRGSLSSVIGPWRQKGIPRYRDCTAETKLQVQVYYGITCTCMDHYKSAGMHGMYMYVASGMVQGADVT